MLGDIAEEEPGNLEGDNEFDYFDDVDEYEAVALNSLLELEVQKMIGKQETPSSYNLLLSLQWGKQVARENPSGSPKERGKERS